MKKLMIFLMAALVLTGTLLVSCNQNVGEDKLGSVTISQDMARTLGSTAESNLPSADSLTWRYKAVKNDDGFFVTGQTDWKSLSGNTLAGQNLGNFSYGAWLFSFEGKDGDNKVIYSCYDLPATISSPQTNLTVPLTIGSGAAAPTVVFKNLSFKLAENSGSAGTTAEGYFKLIVSEGNEEIFTVTTESMTYPVGGVSFVIPNTVTGYTTIGTDPAVPAVQKTYSASTSHTYGFKVEFQKSGSSTWQTVADRTYSVLIPFGAKITISGSVDSIETTGQAIIDGTETHNYAINSDGSWQCSNGHETHTLEGTESPYITVVVNGQPTEIIPLNANHAVGSTGSITVSENNVTYTGSTNGQEVVIRTNGGTLTINAPADTVDHYGNAAVVDVKAIAGSSYHENGDVDLIKVKKGHIELESNAEVLGVYVYNASTETEKDTSFEEIKITVKAGAEVPQLSRSAVEINPTDGTKVCTVVTEESKDIYLFQQGVYEQIKTVDAGENITTHESASWADDGSRNNEKTQTAAYQLANELNASFTVGETTYNVTVNTESENRELVVTNTSTSEVVKDETTVAEIVAGAVDQSASDGNDAVADLPLRGDGLSWDTAFEVYDYATMQKISDYATLGPRYFKVVIEKTNGGHIDCNDWKIVNLNGSFDGKGVILDNLDYFLFQTLSEQENILVKNMIINANINTGDASGRAAAVLRHAADVTRLENISVHGYITSSYVAAFIGWTRAGRDCTLYIDNCYGDAELAGTSASAVLFAHAYNVSSDDRYIYMTDTLYEGIMSGNYHSFITACNAGGAKNKEMYVTFNDASMLSRFRNVCIAILAENTSDNGYQYKWCPGTDILNQSGYGGLDTITGVMGMKNYTRTSAIEVNYHNGSELTAGELVSIAKNSSASTWSARFEVGPNDKNGYGNYVSAYVGPTNLTNDNGILTTTDIYACSVSVNGDATESTGYTSDHTKFNVVNSIYGTTFGSASITITQYDSNGRLVQIDVWDLKK